MIYLLEDDDSIRELVCYSLNKTGIDAVGFSLPSAFYDALAREIPELVLLDIMLPEEDGFSVLSRLRTIPETKNVPVIMMTARDSEYDKVKALDGGADDYVTKPFSPSELVARVDSLYRRIELQLKQSSKMVSEEITLGEFTLNTRRRSLLKNGKNIELTQVEFQIVEYFFTHPDVALDRSDILNRVWGEAYFGEEKIVDVNIRRLRMKIEDHPSSPSHLVTVWGLGYKWVSE